MILRKSPKCAIYTPDVWQVCYTASVYFTMCLYEWIQKNRVYTGRAEVVMALYEDHDRHTNPYWQARLARERLNISESVEETLSDTSSQEQWSDDEQQYISSDRALSSTELVPPRLSLQSKVQPSVRPASFVQSVTAEIAAQQAAAKEKEEQRKPHSTNILARLAQRFTSSIAAIMQPDDITWEPTRHEQDVVSPQERYLPTLPPTYAITPIENAQTPTVIDAIPATPSQPATPPVKSKQRLAGHTSKVQLQTAQIPRVTPYPKENDIYAWHRETKEPLREPLSVNVRLREKVHEVPSVSQPIKTVSDKETQVQREKHLEESATRSPNADCLSFFGTGTFERGQGELMVRNTHAVATSVVHVTLTSNPGPTLVQYISLHPEVGFTLHLTAPADAKTTFNYVMFVDNCL